MSFLSKMNKPKPVGVKPVTPMPTVKSDAEKSEIKKPAPLTKPAIKKPMPLGVNKPAMSKPNPLKKAITPVVEEPKEELVTEPQVEETVTDSIEVGQEVNLGIAPEQIEETVEVKVEEVVEEVIEVEEKQEVVEEIKEEPKEEVKEEVEAKEETEEEESPQKRAARTRKKNQENKKRKQALEEHKAELAKGEASMAIISLPKVDINRIEDYMYPVVLPSVDTWEEEKQEVREVVNAIEIDPDVNSATAKVVLSDLASAYSTLTSRLTHYKTQYENLTGKDGIIECVKSIYGQGKNAEERKFAATQACMNYTKAGEEEAVNLFEFEYMVRDRYYFYEGVVKELEFKRQLLITFNGMLNIESRI